VFSFFFPREYIVRGREKGAPPLRRAEEEQVKRQDSADAPRSEGTPVVTRKGEEAVRVVEGAGPEQGQPRRRQERLRRATVYPEPATPTPWTRCESRPNPLHLFPLLDFFSVLNRRRWGTPSGDLAWVRAIEPQDCRPATVWCSRATHAPVPAVAVRGPLVAPVVEPGVSCAGNGCAATPP
jgi:hypothetical protein